jgi:glycosyltransferase involved in cell wall biosynthesis
MPVAMPDGRPWPKISMVTVSFNQGKFIEQAIRSVLLQGYPNLEYIVIDAVSKDQSVEIIRKYAPWLTYWVSEPDRGMSDALNKGFARATGEFGNWINCDDYLLPGALKAVAQAYAASPVPCGVVGVGRWVNVRGRTLWEHTPADLSAESLAACGENWVPQPACFFPIEAYRAAGGVEDDFHYAMDFDLFIRIRKKVPFVRVGQVLSVATSHPDAKTKARRYKMFAEVRIIQCRHGAEDAARKTLEKDYARLERYDRLTAPLRRNPLVRLVRWVLGKPKQH